jgi:hypothetical protein
MRAICDDNIVKLDIPNYKFLIPKDELEEQILLKNIYV